jgi:dTDP-4-dehydrorhamnose 3,5-epimerase
VIEGVLISKPPIHRDDRGWFAEIFRAGEYPLAFAQANHSRSNQHVLRGLHYHRWQADLWHVVSGRAQVALADLRDPRNPPKVEVQVLDGGEPTALYIPAGVAHGFLALTDLDLIYQVTREYDETDEHGVAWNDPTLAVPWDIENPILSERDVRNPELNWDLIPSFS